MPFLGRITPPLTPRLCRRFWPALIEVEVALDFDVAEHLEIRDLPLVRELLSPPGSSLRCVLRSKKSA
jgi:hypothetical protein